MAGENKTIKVSIAVDEQSSRQFNRIIEATTASVKKLADTTTKAMSGLAGGSVTNRSMQPGQAGGYRHYASPGAQKQQGILGSVFGTDAQGIRSMVQGTESAMRTVSTSLKSFVTSATSDIAKLHAAIAGVNTSMGAMGGGRRGGGWDPPSLSNLAAGAMPRRPFGSNMPLDLVPPAFRGGGMGGGPPGGGAGGGGWFGGGGLGIGGALSQGASMMGLGFIPSALRVAGPVGMAVAAAAGAYEYGAGAYQDNRIANLKQTISQPIAFEQRMAGVAAPFQEQYQRFRHGHDVAYSVALNQVRTNPGLRSVVQGMASERLDLRLREAGINDPRLSSLPGRLRGGVGSLVATGVDGGNGGAGAAMAASGGYLPMSVYKDMQAGGDGSVGTRNVRDIRRELELRHTSQDRAEAERALAQARFDQMSPRQREIVNMLGSPGSAMGTLGLQRQGMLGPGRNDPRDPAEYMKQLEAGLTASGYTASEFAGARRSIVSGAGKGYLRYIGGRELLSMQAGGAHGVEGMARMGGMLGDGARYGGSMKDALQSSIGSGGLDVTAGSDLFSHLGQRSMRFMSDISGTGAESFMRASAGLVGGGLGAPLDVGEQQRRGMMLNQGLDSFGSMTQGTAAPLYQATSVIGNMQAAGGNMALGFKLGHLDPSVLQGIARGGNINPSLSGMGMTQDVAIKALANQRKTPFYSTLDKTFQGETGSLLGEMRSFESTGGSWVDLVKDKTKNLTGAQKAREMMRLTETLGGAAFGGSAGLFAQLVGDEDFAPMLKAKGAHGIGPKGTLKAALGNEAAQMNLDAAAIGNAVKAGVIQAITDLNKNTKGAEEAIGALNGLRDKDGKMNAAGEAAAFGIAVNAATTAVMNLKKAMDAASGAGRPVKGNR